MQSIVTLISGRGTNFEAIVKTAQKEQWPVQFAGVIANRAAAAGLDFARSQGIPAFFIEHQDFATRELFDAALIEKIDELGADLVVLAGFMRILTPHFIRHYAGRLINIHPALLPAFPGLHTHERALEAGVTEHGATVHFVTEGVDEGPIICQASVPVLAGDNADTLAARVLAAEHQIYPRAVKWFLDGRLRIEGKQAKLFPEEPQLIKL
ncbi:formyltetrahydrofolate-dependent phosphoribosylglycinamide formyltransferase [Polynucleobacter meluiroseus]|uniref:Phosphoribosylglycinamide formyltransferase n=1 Tax=Polynucleobacter meluiroseus TaxID=1938814 RepID=A0A240DXS4_9BURK|nr:phosphoribosylglycinamide formyltransferase [Polynucleobacter meluiroseus]SNX27999.1 formyltetrahydrofolate-dependent phosphoribosylglycinamide formyltransferase [Polynucleobacter meluiroseus]